MVNAKKLAGAFLGTRHRSRSYSPARIRKNDRVMTLKAIQYVLAFSLILWPLCSAFIRPSRPLGLTLNSEQQRYRAFRRDGISTKLAGVRDVREPADRNRPLDENKIVVGNTYLESLSTNAKEETSSLQSAQTAVQNTASSVSSVVQTRITSDLKNVASAATFGLASVAEKGNSNLKSFASTAKSSVTRVAERGSGDLRATSLRAKQLAERGTNSAFMLAEKGVSELQSFTQEGSTRVGEVAQWIDSQAKMGTQQVSSKAKSLIQNFTGKDNYRIGDVTKELLRRIASQEVNISDTILLLKILLVVGASFGPLVKALPFTVLLEALNVSLEQKIGGKVLEALAMSLDDRLSAAFTSDDKVQLGDAVKRSLLSGILAFTGQKSYKSGDIQRKVATHDQEEVNKPAEMTSIYPVLEANTQKQLDIRIDAEFDQWDKLFRESCEQNELALLYSDKNGPIDEASAKDMDMKIATELEEWNALFRKKYSDHGL
jgi:hypothetical protein